MRIRHVLVGLGWLLACPFAALAAGLGNGVSGLLSAAPCRARRCVDQFDKGAPA